MQSKALLPRRAAEILAPSNDHLPKVALDIQSLGTMTAAVLGGLLMNLLKLLKLASVRNLYAAELGLPAILH